MNTKALRAVAGRVACFSVVILLGITFGCRPVSQPAPKLGVTNWKPKALGGTLEVRPIPSSQEIVVEWDKWLDSEAEKKARVYEITLRGASNQMDFNVEITKENSPVGNAYHTYVRFLYKDPTNGLYQFVWHRLGRHAGDFLLLRDQPKTVWTRLSYVENREQIPILQIEAFESMEPGAGIIAKRGRKSEK